MPGLDPKPCLSQEGGSSLLRAPLVCEGCVPGRWAEEGWARVCSEALRRRQAASRARELWQPALTLPSLRGPVLSCPEVLHCAQLGAAQYKMHRGGRQRGARKRHSPLPLCPAPTGLSRPPPPPRHPAHALELSGPSSRAKQQAVVTGFMYSAKSRAHTASRATRSADLVLPNISQHSGKK